LKWFSQKCKSGTNERANQQTEDVAVSIDATHYCVKSRGVMDTNSQTSTTALGGCFKENIHTRAEFLNP
jgi:GTP cyclohydrolase I